MATKYLTGTYSSGYTLSGAYKNLVVESSALVGGTGVTSNYKATITNYGRVHAYYTGSNGVSLYSGGTLTNGSSTDTAALIEGRYGVYAQGKLATIANFGTIEGDAAGVLLEAGGAVTNGSAKDATAFIYGALVGIYAANTSAMVANFGVIAGLEGGIQLAQGGTVTNGSAAHPTARIEGIDGVGITGPSAAVANFGTIRGFGGSGVSLDAGGTVTNGSPIDTTALIEGYGIGVTAGVSAAIVNYGTILGTNAQGVHLYAGTLTNGAAAYTTALIYGVTGVYAANYATTIANFGAILGHGDSGIGVFLYGGGTVTNGSAADTSAVIAGNYGVFARGPATIANYGTITGNTLNGPLGINLKAGGTVTNGSADDTTAVIAGYVGIYAGGAAATVTNFGTIMGTSLALDFSSANDVLVVEAGSAFVGAVQGGAGTLVLASGVGRISDLTFGDVTVSGSMATTTFTNFGTLKIGSGARFNLTGSGAIASGGTAILTDNGVFTVTGALVVAGTVNGTGTLAVAGGTLAVDFGATIGVADWSLTGGTATMNESFTYKGAFSESAGGTLKLTKGATLTLTGADTLSGLIDGGGKIRVSSVTAGGLTIGGTATFEDAGAVKQTGTVTVGDATTNAAILVIDAGASWAIRNNSGIALGTATTSSIKNSGLLIKSGGTGTSKIAVAVADPGAIEAAKGTLDFTRNLTGGGTMAVDSGATLEADKSAASTLSMTFNGGHAILALKDPAAFAATIHHFAPTDTIDLLKIAATFVTLKSGDALVIKNNGVIVATLQLAGDYTGATFAVASDGKGGTNVTVTTAVAAVGLPESHQFIAAMAGLGGSAGNAVHAGEAWLVRAPVLARPRAMVA